MLTQWGCNVEFNNIHDTEAFARYIFPNKTRVHARLNENRKYGIFSSHRDNPIPGMITFEWERVKDPIKLMDLH